MIDYFKYFNSLNEDKTHFVNSNDICTPMECVKEMVDTIPEIFWKKDIKILDPCCGNGNFPAYIATKTKLENIYFNEINKKRISNLKKFFGNNINLTEKDFLEEDFDNYDLIVANPPFALFTDGKRAAKNHNVSKLFIKKSLELLNENGYLLYIIPDNFMSLSDSNDTFELLSRYDILYLNIHNAKKYFKNVGSSFVYFLLRKSSTDIKTIIDNGYLGKKERTEVDLHNMKFLPLYFNEETKTILSKTLLSSNEKWNIETTSDLHATTKKYLLSDFQDEEHPYRLRHTKIQQKFSKRPHKYQEGYKCFICLTSYYETFVDDCGMTQSIAFIRCASKEEAEKTAKILDHPLYHFLNDICRYGNFNNIRILQLFPKTFENPYEAFNITENEIKMIENFYK